MNKTIKVDPDTLSSIKVMLTQNLNLNQINNNLKNDKKVILFHTTLRGLIHRELGKTWDKQSKSWIDLDPIPAKPKNYISGQLVLDVINNIEKDHL
ncbi:MAG TPA: hypothetical protein VIO64_05620 [Pseudobacteroides sp.]|uniref:hypothetical protein n=1 Tax=Pseudobacteroides sp. TaxID=1968840 RepID=UPI002F9485C7